MNLKSALVVGAFSVLALNGCNKSAKEIGKDIDETAAELATKGEWTSPCLDMSIGWELAGLSSQKEQYNFYADGVKSVNLYGADNCTAAKIELRYEGDVEVGEETAQGNNTIDLKYTKVTAKVLDQATVDSLNSPLVPSCGFDGWVLGEARDVTAQAGDINCPIGKAVHVYDIIKPGGSFIRFGVKDANLDGSTPEKRPTVINNDITYDRK
ncbi:MAG: hypothetical protein EOP05_22920 [Proteobacteria bacterium]|nr:MAG: hypothetical protein EOP05_22920 [Pseudomonadota bacterium]